MLEVHRWRQIVWGPTAVVALATSVDGAVVAAARENGAIELWNVAPGSLGWHCYLTIPGKEDASISSLVWCKSSGVGASSLGRLFSAGLDGFITEWDLQTLQPKGVVESYGGSVWQLAAEPLLRLAHPVTGENGILRERMQNGAADSSDSDENSDVSDDDIGDEGEVEGEAEQRVAVGCDDGCLRLFLVEDSQTGMSYRRTFPPVKGRILSVAWSSDATRIYAGGSDGCIRCWDSSTLRELLRITAGIGGIEGPELCVWSLLVLRDGTIVSGDSTGSTQFWEGKHGTLLQLHTKHGADVLALAACPSHRAVFAAGADGQVVLYQHVDESGRMTDRSATGSTDLTLGPLTEKWTFVGSKRTHTHDVRALAVAFPVCEEGSCSGRVLEKASEKKVRRKKISKKAPDHKKWSQPGTAMLISGGSDSKLFTYPANAFLAFHPHDICPAPQCPLVQLASGTSSGGITVFIAQHSTWVDVWRMYRNHNCVSDMEDGLEFEKEILGKRKVRDAGSQFLDKSFKANRNSAGSDPSKCPHSNGKEVISKNSRNPRELAKGKGIAPELMARIKCKTAEHICCSAISSDGQYVAFSDRLKPRLYQLEHQGAGVPGSKKMKGINQRKFHANLPAVQSIHFTPDSTRLLLGSPRQIMVVDVESAEMVHSFRVDTAVSSGGVVNSASPLKLMCTSADSQWLAATSSSGHVHVFNLETLRHHWTVPLSDGSVATSAVFRPGSSNVLIISTPANQIHVLDVEAKELSEWSKMNGDKISRYLLDFPGPIVGLSVPPTSTSTSVIAYSSRAMCQIDFSKPLREPGGEELRSRVAEKEGTGGKAELNHSSTEKSHVSVNGNGVHHKLNGHSDAKSNFVVVPFKDPVLFLGHTAQSSLLVVEKPWLEVLRRFAAPVFRHLYGT